MTDEEYAAIKAIEQAPTPTSVSALLKAIICHWQWTDNENTPADRQAIAFGFNHKSRMDLATAFACVQREELRLTKEAVLEQSLRDLFK